MTHISLEHYFSGLMTLGQITPEKSHSVEAATLTNSCLHTFNNMSYSMTITIKGAHKHRLLEFNLRAQFQLFRQIRDIIDTHSKYYFIAYELHKSGDYLHSHLIFEPKFRSKINKLRAELYQHITGHKLTKKSYKHRILVEKISCVTNWITYIMKDIEDTAQYLAIKPHYKLKTTKNKFINKYKIPYDDRQTNFSSKVIQCPEEEISNAADAEENLNTILQTKQNSEKATGPQLLEQYN